MRVAWIGPDPGDEGGVANVATLILQGLAELGIEVDCFITGNDEDLPRSLRAPGLRIVGRRLSWEWGRWYSRTPLLSFLTGLGARARAHLSVADELVAEHRRRRYDVLYQFSQIELFRLRRLRAELPPIVLHPEVHAAGELKWHRRELALARRHESRHRWLMVEATLMTRARIQRRDMQLATHVIAPSRAFARHLARDYRVPSDRLHVIPNPIDLDRFHPMDPRARRPERRDRPITVLFVSRLSVRKGVELVTNLSHRIADLEGRVRIRVIGGPSLWSDYRGLLRDLHPAIGTYGGEVPSVDLPNEYHSADMLIQPSHYEPFALTVGEALACGLPVIASDEVGAAEGVDSQCCSVFPSGDVHGLEHAVRELVNRIQREGQESIGRIARTEAVRLFAKQSVASAVASSLRSAASVTASGSAAGHAAT